MRGGDSAALNVRALEGRGGGLASLQGFRFSVLRVEGLRLRV